MRSGRRGAVWSNLNAPIKALKYNLKALKKENTSLNYQLSKTIFFEKKKLNDNPEIPPTMTANRG